MLLASLDTAAVENIEHSFADFMATLSSGDSSSLMNMVKSVFSTATSIAHNVFSFIVALVFSLYILLDKDRVFRGLNTFIEMTVPARFADTLRHAGHVANRVLLALHHGPVHRGGHPGNAVRHRHGHLRHAVRRGRRRMRGPHRARARLRRLAGRRDRLSHDFDRRPHAGRLVCRVPRHPAAARVASDTHPNVVGASVGLPGIWVFAAVLVGGALFGVVGMFLGVPTVATLRTLAIDRAAEIRARRKELAEQQNAACSDEAAAGAGE